MSPFSLPNKTALVTGAGSGIGAAIASTFAESGGRIICADIDEAAATAQAGKIRETGGNADAVAVDVTSLASCQAAFESVGPVDILVNNAGVGAVGTLLEAEPEDLDRLYAVNVKGSFHMAKVWLPAMIERGSGNILNMASIGGVVGIRDRLAYCTSKFAVVGMTKSMALDHADAGIRVNCICPGRVETPFVKARLQEYPDPEAAYREMSATQLFGRMIRPDEVASAALYLASDASHMITGTAFLIDCGWSAGK